MYTREKRRRELHENSKELLNKCFVFIYVVLLYWSIWKRLICNIINYWSNKLISGIKMERKCKNFLLYVCRECDPWVASGLEHRECDRGGNWCDWRILAECRWSRARRSAERPTRRRTTFIKTIHSNSFRTKS